MKAQRGFVALLMIVLIAVGVFGAMAAWVASEPPPSKQSINRVVLAQAKEALLAYVVGAALSGHNTRLPCPNITGDGKADEASIPRGAAKPCGLAGNAQLGLLPWNALSLPPLRDAYGECLWYAVDGRFKNALAPDATLGVNADTDGRITVKDEAGNILADNVVAVVFARSAQAGSQARSASADGAPPCATTPSGDAAQDAATYLGSSNAAPATNPLTSVALLNATQLASDKASLTHQLIWITADEFAAVATQSNAEVLLEALTQGSSAAGDRLPFAADKPRGQCIKGLYSGFLPSDCPVAITGGASPFILNAPKAVADDWDQQAFYAVSPGCEAPDCIAILSVPVNTKAKAVILMRGRRQSNPKCPLTTPNSTLTQSLPCIESQINADALSADPTGSAPFVKPDSRPISNDILKERT